MELKNTVVVFFTAKADNPAERHCYAAYLLTGTYVYVGDWGNEVREALTASGIPWGDEPNPQNPRKYGVERKAD